MVGTMAMGAATQGSAFGGTQGAPTSSQPSGSSEKGYIKEAKLVTSFLKTFTDDTDYKYMRALQKIANRESTVLEIDLNDLLGWQDDEELLHRVENNTMRYISLFADAADELMPEPTSVEALAEIERERAMGEDPVHTVEETIRQQRLAQTNANGQQNEEDEAPDPLRAIPKALMRRYRIHIAPDAKTKACSLRQVKAKQIGSFVKIQGIVTKITDVKPLMVVATYACDSCGFEIYQQVPQKQFTPLQQCPTEQCKSNKKSQRVLTLQTRRSKFVKYQELKLQEMPHQVPIGHIPRTTTVQVKGENTRICKPGDCVTISGVFLPERPSAYAQMKIGLTTQTYVECLHIERHKKDYSDISNTITADIEAQIDEEALNPEIYSKIARSIAPEIFGLEDVKKAMLLQLVGGATRKLSDGMKIRGDINICLMGDPGVAKSQLLKHMTTVSPRSVYTTGKGSSGVGLTAAVTKDKITGEITLEGGALVLADMGICCIDEFDKMEEADRTAIHEVMEQQTVSIAKAGVTTTLNARTSILAAANPIYGRYNKKYSPSENINLPAALLSRFDLMFLLLDVPNVEYDTNLASHVTHVHRYKKHPELDFEPLSPAFIRAYVSQAKKVEPYVPEHLQSTIVEQYVSMRQEDANDAAAAGCQALVTARQLLSVLRMAQALARLRFDEEVSHTDITEAIRLVRASKASLEEEDDDPASAATDIVTRIYSIIRDLMPETGVLKYSELEPVCLAKGFTTDHLDRCLEEYEQLNVLQVNAARTKITFVEA